MSNDEQSKILDELALKINHLQNERQKAENEAYIKYMDDCIELLEEYGVFPSDGEANDGQIKRADLILDYVKLKRKQFEFPVIQSRKEEHTKKILERDRQEMRERISKEFSDVVNGRTKRNLPV